jgi:hypothetical protein
MRRVLLPGLLWYILAGTAFAATTEEVIEAAKQNEDVQVELGQARLAVNGNNSESADVISLGGVCGVAGCNFSKLVVIRVHRGGVNPQTATILAKVEERNGKIEKVGLVQLWPKKHLEE